MNRLKLLLIACSLNAVVIPNGYAEELKWTHYGVRPLAMGNAYVAVADDFNALFYNPAGLARLKEWDGEFFNPTLAISKNTIDFIDDMAKLSGESDSTDQVLEILESNTGKSHHFSLGFTPHLVFPGFGFAAGLELVSNMAIHREVAAEVQVGPRVTIPFGYARNFLDDTLSVGAAIKFVGRGGVNHEFSIDDIEAMKETDELDRFVEGGTGVGVDLGLLYTPTKTMEPTLGISIADFGGTPYEKQNVGGESLGAPRPRLPAVNTGFSMVPWKMGQMALRTSVDAHAINQPIHFSKKFNLGTEWNYGSIIKVQSGLHQGLFAGGFEFDVFLLSIRFATYAEQLGTVAGQDENLADRRYVMQMKLLL